MDYTYTITTYNAIINSKLDWIPVIRFHIQVSAANII